MPELDGFAALRMIADHADAFSEVNTEAAKAARELVVKQLKSKSLTVEGARAVRDALGSDTFDLIVDGLTNANLKSIVTKLDKHHPEIKGANAQWRRQHLRTLLDGIAEPTGKPTRPKKAALRAGPDESSPTPIGFRTEAMSVYRESLKRK